MFYFNPSGNQIRFLILILFIHCLKTFASINECKEFIEPGINCTITINKTEENFPQIRIANSSLHINDILEIEINNKKKKIEIFSDGLIILPVQETYKFYLHTVKVGPKRKLGIFSNEKTFNINELNSFTILIESSVKLNDGIFVSNSDEESGILLSSVNRGVSASPVFNTTNDSISLDDKDFFTNANNIRLNFILNGKDDNRFDFKLIKASKSCSGYVNVENNPVELKSIDMNAELIKSSLTCVYLVNTSGGNLQITGFKSDSENLFESIMIKDGLKLTSADLINSPVKDASTYLNKLDRSISSNGSFLVIFSTSFVDTKYKQSVVTIKKTNHLKKNIEGDFELNIKEETIAIFSFSDKYPFLTLGQNAFELKNSDLIIYNSLDLTNEPILTFKNGEFVNNQLWSDKKNLVLKFTNSDSSTPVQLKGNLKGLNINCNRMSNNPSTFILNATEELKDQTCNFYFKPKDVTRSVIFNLENFLLSAEACLSLKYVSSQQFIFKFCQPKDAKDALEKSNLRGLILKSNDSYVLTYDQKKIYKDRILVQASFTCNSLPLVRNYNLNKDQPNHTIQSYNYPSDYPYIVNARDLDLIQSDSNMFVSFVAQNLHSGDKLNLFKSINQTLDFIDDFIVNSYGNNSQLLVSLVTKFDNFNDVTLNSNSFTSGFKINVERVDCILNFDSGNKILKTPGYPKKFENPTRCVSIINLSDKNRAKYLHITITNGKDDVNYGDLTIYDDFTIHRNISSLVHKFNQTTLKNNEVLYLNTSSSKIILEFQPTSDKLTSVNGFQIKIDEFACPSDSCDDKNRCLLESINCNYLAECIDRKDEMNCPVNNTIPANSEKIVYRGLSNWIITFIIIPLSMLVGWTIARHGSKLMTRFRGHTYQEFNTFSENA